MKILHCNTNDDGGGAAIAARRIHKALCQQNINSAFGVLRRTSDDPTVLALSNQWRRMLDPAIVKLEKIPLLLGAQEKKVNFSLGLIPSFVHQYINALSTDIVHLHWITNGFIPLFSLARLRKPVVMTLHDTWAFTGGCHILKGCSLYKMNCAACPQIPRMAQLSARLSFEKKRRIYKQLQPFIVTPSKSFQERIAKSALLHDAFCRHIPNCIDIGTFAPLEKSMARHILQIPQTDKLIAFGAVAATSDPNKGFDLLTQTLQFLKQFYPYPVRLLVFGTSSLPEMKSLYPIHCLGQLHDTVSLRLTYSAADIFVCPSREENLPNTILESFACGTPVAAFSVGGIPDMVEHGVTGCLATPHDPEELARGIANILNDSEHRAAMGNNARNIVKERYASPVIARQYIALYEEILTHANQ